MVICYSSPGKCTLTSHFVNACSVSSFLYKQPHSKPSCIKIKGLLETLHWREVRKTTIRISECDIGIKYEGVIMGHVGEKEDIDSRLRKKIKYRRNETVEEGKARPLPTLPPHSCVFHGGHSGETRRK